MASAFKQSFFLSKPTLTEANLPDQTGRVCIITGGYAGVGKALSKIVYEKNATVYVAGRSADKAEKAISSIKSEVPNSKGKIEFLSLDLSDLATIKPAVKSFTEKEQRLDVLINNAGVMFPPLGSKDKQGDELQIGTNCIGHYLLAELLTPLLESTAAASPAGSVRVAWAGSLGVDVLSPKHGVTLDEAGNYIPHPKSTHTNYGASKAGNYFLASEYAKHHPVPADGKGVISTCFNPGNLQTELQRHVPWWQDLLLRPGLYPARFGAYTELFCGWSADVTAEHNGGYVWPWGRFGGTRSDIQAALQTGGTAEKFWAWCDSRSKSFA